MADFRKCKQCGQCCIVLNSKGEWEDCKYLIRYIRGEGENEKPTRCMIYPHRLYAIVGKNQYCGKRSRWGYNAPNCPFNDLKFKMHPKYLK